MAWEWSEEKYRAASLIARGKKGDDVAEQCGVSSRTIDSWKTEPEFRDELAKQKREMRQRVIAGEFADTIGAVWPLRDYIKRMDAVVKQRSQDESLREWKDKKSGEVIRPAVAGGDTGLIVRTKVSRFGETFAVDKGLLDQRLKYQEQALRIMGLWDKDEVVSKQVVIVVPQAVAPQQKAALEIPADEPPLELPGVVADLAPEQR